MIAWEGRVSRATCWIILFLCLAHLFLTPATTGEGRGIYRASPAVAGAAPAAAVSAGTAASAAGAGCAGDGRAGDGCAGGDGVWTSASNARANAAASDHLDVIWAKSLRISQ